MPNNQVGIRDMLRHGDVCVTCIEVIEFDSPAIPHQGNGRGQVRMCKKCEGMAIYSDVRARVEQGTERV
jgi:hypothetical protein